MQTSREHNRPCTSCHNTDRRKRRNLRTASLFGKGSLDSALSRNSSALLDSPGLYWRDQFVDPCSTWTLGCCTDHTTLDRRNEVIEKRGQLVHGCCFVKREEGLFLARMEPNHAGSGTTAYSGGSPQEACHGNTFSGTEISSYTGSQIPQCQAEGCKANLSSAKPYHRRHKVCELHSKSPTVVVSGLIQRFCQQCSRFHPTSEFDEGKRSCRKRLADHNRRRRKTKPRHCTTSQSRAGTTDPHDHNKRAKALSDHNYDTRIQIIPNMIGSTSTTPTLITSVRLSSSGTMTMFPNNYKEQISVLQGTSNDKTSAVEFLYANIPQTVSYLSTRGTVDI